MRRREPSVEPRGAATFERRTVLLHTRDGQSFRGVLTHAYEDCAVLEHVETYDGDRPVKVGGEVVVACENISWFQTVTTSDDARDG